MTTFISYSRVHSEFVVRLARDLKAAGYDVWLDQLDIPKGARWDDAIEAAVERSATFMIVLSPESIESQNVKDELSYAIDSGKYILPVVIHPCKIPLRLRRFQYVDFTDKPYKESLADIKRLLSNTQRRMQAAPEEPAFPTGEPSALVTGPLLGREAISTAEPFQQEETVPPGRLKHLLVPVSTAVLALAIVGGVVAFALSGNQAPAAPLPAATDTLTPAPPTMTFTSTVIPAPSEVPDARGVTMRLVSAGDFIMGSESAAEGEQQAQIRFVELFYIDKYEVTNLQYRACVQSGACQPPAEVDSATRVGYYSKPEFNSYPVVNVDWNMARSYCEWRGARLPTEEEWEKAARGSKGDLYPGGDEISCDQANYAGCQKDTVRVSEFEDGVSPYGVYNMAGNVSEWVSSLYLPYPYDVFDGREDLEAPGERVIRGGSWLGAEGEAAVRSDVREQADPSTAREDLGFRCVRTPDETFLAFAFVADTPENGSTATAVVATSRSRRTQEARASTTPTRVSPSPTLRTTRTPTKTPVIVITITLTATTQPPPIVTTETPITVTTEVPIVTTESPPIIITITPQPPYP